MCVQCCTWYVVERTERVRESHGVTLGVILGASSQKRIFDVRLHFTYFDDLLSGHTGHRMSCLLDAAGYPAGMRVARAETGVVSGDHTLCEDTRSRTDTRKTY